jgi:succinate dehydrogenase/fumarate reductase flavoprotein subunit
MAGEVYDVIVVGAGNAGLTAALAARQQETRVLLLDKCPKAVRGGETPAFPVAGFVSLTTVWTTCVRCCPT